MPTVGASSDLFYKGRGDAYSDEDQDRPSHRDENEGRSLLPEMIELEHLYRGASPISHPPRTFLEP